MGSDGNSPDYYPFRWKVADAAEDVFALHRRKLLAAIALVLVASGVGAVAFFGSSNDSGSSVASEGSPTTSTATVPDDTEEPPSTATATTAATTTDAPTTSATTSTTTTSTSTTTTTPPPTTTAVSARAPESDAQLNSTEAGSVIEMSDSTILIVGGLPSDAMADDTLSIAQTTFAGLSIVDEQVVDDSFPEPDKTRFRLSAPDLFGYNSADLGATYLSVIDQLAAALIANESWTVEVTGHTDDTGPSQGNQRLSERRAQSAAARLIGQGVEPNRITVRGLGEDSPIAPNDTEQGRLANRRVEFDVTR